jgi:4-aminobutyrate aminotransferase-like enzyme
LDRATTGSVIMTTSEQDVAGTGTAFGADATQNLWLHFSRMGAYRDAPPPVIVRGEGASIFDDRGRRYLDGLAGLFVVQAGHGRRVLAEAARGRRRNSPTSRCGPTRTRRRSSCPSGSPRPPPAT